MDAVKQWLHWHFPNIWLRQNYLFKRFHCAATCCDRPETPQRDIWRFEVYPLCGEVLFQVQVLKTVTFHFFFFPTNGGLGLFQATSASGWCLRWLQPHIDFIGSAAALTYLTIFWPLKHALSSCAPVRPAQKMKRVKHLPETEDFSITSAVKDTKKEKISDNELPDSIRGLISLDSNTVRYLNKRKPSDKTNSAYTLHASRANVVSIFMI